MVLRLLAVLLILLAPAMAGAHPHAWIDLTVRVLFDGQGRATGLSQTWLFDDFYTAYALEGLGVNPDGTPSADAMDTIREQNLANLREYDYFTRVRLDGADVALANAIEDSSAMSGARMSMSFTLPFAEPLEVRGYTLEYAVFDPSYYIEMLHADRFDAIALEGAPDDCTFDLIAPNPSLDALSLAASLDRTQAAPQNMGELFAQTVTVTCP